MPRVTLVNPPNHVYDRLELAPPLGLLVLADVAIASRWTPTILDFCLPQHDKFLDDPSLYYEYAAEQILSSQPHIVAFSSMGVNSHVALLIAKHIKARDPSLVVVLGGPHFSSIATPLTHLCPWVDAVIVGEGESAFREFLSRCRSAHLVDRLPPIITAPPASAPDFQHPHSAYDFIDISSYFAANDRRLLNYEGARGCVYKCAFCYSPTHYHSARELPVPTVVRDWALLSELGAKHLFAVQDNFTNHPARAIAVCDAITAEDLPITWNAYATMPQLNAQVVAALRRAKCSALYLGVDAVSPTQRVTFNKRFYRDDSNLVRLLSSLIDAGIEATCAFMLDLFKYDPSEVEHVFRTASVCAALGCPIRINVFTRYPGSKLAETSTQVCRYSAAKVRALLDCPEVVAQNPLAELQPRLFPFHCTEISEGSWVHRLRLVRIAQSVISRYSEDVAGIVEAGHELLPGFTELASQWSEIDSVPKPQWRERLAALAISETPCVGALT